MSYGHYDGHISSRMRTIMHTGMIYFAEIRETRFSLRETVNGFREKENPRKKKSESKSRIAHFCATQLCVTLRGSH